DEHFRLLGISAKLTGLDSKDKIGKYPVAGLVFSVECPPLGCPVIYGTTQTPLRQAKAGGLIVWIYFDANGKIALDGEVGARINPARLTLGMAKPSGGQLDGIFELTNNTVRRLIEAPYFNGAAVLSLSLGTSIDVDFFALGVRLGNVSTDIGYRAQTTVESSTAVGWGTAKLGEPWSWDGSVCIKTSFGAGVVLSSALEIGTEIDTPWKNNVVGLGYSYSNQWPSEQEMLLLGWHNFLALSIWFTFVGDDSCSFTYTYTGNTFDTFATPSSYTTSDRVTARLTLAGALPPKLKSVDVTGLPGFSLTVSDGHQTLPNANSARAEARISTDSTGKIAGPWSMKIDGETSPAEPSIGSFNSPTNTSDHGAGHIVRGYRDIGYNVLRPGTWAKEVASAP
nr:hypothetical protein [Burkholderiaceae bacterium]